jgi:hypothetical protein
MKMLLGLISIISIAFFSWAMCKSGGDADDILGISDEME